jgi:hypothetical protein
MDNFDLKKFILENRTIPQTNEAAGETWTIKMGVLQDDGSISWETGGQLDQKGLEKAFEYIKYREKNKTTDSKVVGYQISKK